MDKPVLNPALHTLQPTLAQIKFSYPLHRIQGWLSPIEQQTLYALAFLLEGPVLEIGSWVGLSTACLAYGVRDKGQPRTLLTTDLNPGPQFFHRRGNIIDFILPGDSSPRGSCDLTTYRRFVRPIIKRPGRALGQLRSNLLHLGLLSYVTILEGDFANAPRLDYHMIFCDATHTLYETSLTAAALQSYLAPGLILACHDIHEDNINTLKELIPFEDAFQAGSLFVGQIASSYRVVLPRAVSAPPAEKSPLVSVIIPTYNRAHLLPRAVLSALHQDGIGSEVIVVDDASTDSTPEVLQRLADPSLHCLRHTTRLGAAAARNTGIRASQGQFITFLDSDDEWLPGMLAAQVRHFASCSPQVGLVFTSFQRIHGQRIRTLPGKLRLLLSRLPVGRLRLQGDLRATLPRGNFITIQTAMLRRACFEQVGLFDESLPRLQDWEFWLRLAREYTFAWTRQTLERSYASPTSISTDTQALTQALLAIQAKHAETYGRELAAHCRFIQGDLELRQRNTSQGQALLWQAARLSPGTLLYWLAAVAAKLGPNAYLWLSRWLGFGYGGE